MKKYIALQMLSSLYRVIAILIICASTLAAIMSGEISYMILGGFGALTIYAAGELVQLLIDIAKSTSLHSEIAIRQYKASLEANPKPRRAKRIVDIKKAAGE
jgi:hypothetical protein